MDEADRGQAHNSHETGQIAVGLLFGSIPYQDLMSNL